MLQSEDQACLSQAQMQNINKDTLLQKQNQQLPKNEWNEWDSPPQSPKSIKNPLKYHPEYQYWQQTSSKYEQKCIKFIQNFFVEINQNFSLELLNFLTKQQNKIDVKGLIDDKGFIAIVEDYNKQYCQKFQEKVYLFNQMDEKLESVYNSIIEILNSKNFIQFNYQENNIPANDNNKSKEEELDNQKEKFKKLVDFWGGNSTQEQNNNVELNQLEVKAQNENTEQFQNELKQTNLDNQFLKPKFHYLLNSSIKFSSQYFYGPLLMKNNGKSVQTDGKGLILFDGFIDENMNYSFKLKIIPRSYKYLFEIGIMDWNNFTFPKLKTEQTGVYSFNTRQLIMIDGEYKSCHRFNLPSDFEFQVTYDKDYESVEYSLSQKIIFNLKNVKKTKLTFFAKIFQAEINII